MCRPPMMCVKEKVLLLEELCSHWNDGVAGRKREDNESTILNNTSYTEPHRREV